MIIAFDRSIEGKFDEMSYDELLTVDDVLHGAFMQVTEVGTEAGAVTVVSIVGNSWNPIPPPELVFDWPFIVSVIHCKTGSPIFLGRVEEPDEPIDA